MGEEEEIYGQSTLTVIFVIVIVSAVLSLFVMICLTYTCYEADQKKIRIRQFGRRLRGPMKKEAKNQEDHMLEQWRRLYPYKTKAELKVKLLMQFYDQRTI